MSLSQYFFTLFLAGSLVFGGFQAVAKTLVHAATKKQMKLLKVVDSKYQKRHGIHMKLKKTITLGLLGSQRVSQGQVWLDRGRLRLEIEKPEKSKIIAGKKFLWIETPPSEGFEGSKTQVLKASLESSRAKSQGLIQLLTQGGVLKYFKVTGVQKAPEGLTYFLQPNSQSVEFKRAQIEVNIKKKEISELRYWDQVDNETAYAFSKPQFDQKINPSHFQYQPPKDAEVIGY